MKRLTFAASILAASLWAVLWAAGCGDIWGGSTVADFTYAPQNPWPFEEVAFTDLSSSCCTVFIDRQWTFEDAVPPASVLPNPLVQFLSEGPHLVTLSVTTKEGLVSTATQVVMVGNPVANDPPIAYNDSSWTVGPTPVDITLTGTDPEGGPLTFFIDAQPPIGTLDDSNIPLVTYAPPAAGGFWGVTSFSFHCEDDISQPSNIATVWVGVDDSPPVANSDFITLTQDVLTPVTLVAADPDTDPIIFVIDTLPQHGQLSGTPPNLDYMPDPGYTGPDQFTFHASDHVFDSAAAVINLDVQPGAGNQPPIAYDMNEMTYVDQPFDIFLNGVDPDETPVEFWIMSLPANGLLIPSSTPPYPIAGNMVTYEPFSLYTGNDSFQFRCFDGVDWSNTATVDIFVSP
ncbi:MAG: hypothetical protein JW909_07570 [Planctomycetes bacterium]|nr:hypothetical protein [Planctomycetota bacterium]